MTNNHSKQINISNQCWDVLRNIIYTVENFSQYSGKNIKEVLLVKDSPTPQLLVKLIDETSDETVMASGYFIEELVEMGVYKELRSIDSNIIELFEEYLKTINNN